MPANTVVYVEQQNFTNGILYGAYFGNPNTQTPYQRICSSWILFPGENMWSNELRSFLYFVALVYCFMGIAIVADKFMDAIEYITSRKRTYQERDPATGDWIEVSVEFWNPTVANLTLMALGSSAPEILLSLIETIMTIDTLPGELGPSTIVGSAAFNLLFISAVCIVSVDRVKRINDAGVFSITAAASVWAYLWMYIVLAVWTPDEVQLIEAILTFVMFPLLVMLAYAADAGYFCKKKSNKADDGRTIEDKKIIDVQKRKTVTASCPDLEAANESNTSIGMNAVMSSPEYREDIKELREQARDKGMSDRDAETWVAQQLALKHDASVHESKAFAKSTVTGILTGGKKTALVGSDEQTKVQFVSSQLEVNEGDLKIDINLLRTGNPLVETSVRVKTRDVKDCEAGRHYKPIDRVVHFPGGDVHSRQIVTLEVVDDEKFEPDRLLALDLSEPSGRCKLGAVYTAFVTIVDDDFPGTFEFSSTATRCYEGDGMLRVAVERKKGCQGRVSIKYKCTDGTATGKPLNHVDSPNEVFNYWNADGQLVFENGEKQQFIEVRLINNEEVSSDTTFEITLFDPEGKATLNPKASTCHVTIMDDDGYRKFVQSVLGKAALGLNLFGRDSDWTAQFRDSMTPLGGEDSDLEPSCCDLTMHFTTFFWKVLFSFVPPVRYWGGWAAFFVALALTGAITAVVAELASLFGCTVNLRDSVTAITFVALGTSLPDTFASMQVAKTAEYADAAVGNVTGSNSVNVFLGLGLPWLVACIIKGARGEKYIVPAGDLGFSVAVFTVVAIIGILLLVLKRLPCLGGGELGGPCLIKYSAAFVMICLWMAYVVLSTMKVYGYISSESLPF